MKGTIFNIFEEAVTAEFGVNAWPELVDAADVSGGYTSLGSYPDDEFLALVATAAGAIDKSQAEVLQWFGRAAVPLLAKRHGEFFENHQGGRSLILSVNDIIRPEVQKLHSGAGCPYFHFDEDEKGRLLIGYRSPRQLCQLAHGFLDGAAEYFGETVEIEHLLCTHNSDPLCRMAVAWNA